MQCQKPRCYHAKTGIGKSARFVLSKFGKSIWVMSFVAPYICILLVSCTVVWSSPLQRRANNVENSTENPLDLPIPSHLLSAFDLLYNSSDPANTTIQQLTLEAINITPNNASISLALNTSSTLTANPVTCSSGLWGTANLASCQQVVGLLPNDNTQFSVGIRGEGTFGATIPWRVLSRELISSS